MELSRLGSARPGQARGAAGSERRLIWALVNLIINLLSTTTFAALLLETYRRFACDGELDTSKLNITDFDRAAARFQITKKRVLIAGTVGVLVASVIGVAVARGVRLNDDVAIIAHRGASASAPENTMAAVREAIEAGADWVEIDVQETADGEVVVFHDSDFMKLAGVDLKIWDAHVSEVLSLHYLLFFMMKPLMINKTNLMFLSLIRR